MIGDENHVKMWTSYSCAQHLFVFLNHTLHCSIAKYLVYLLSIRNLLFHFHFFEAEEECKLVNYHKLETLIPVEPSYLLL